MEVQNTFSVSESNKFIDRKFEMNKRELDQDKQKLSYESEILNCCDKYLMEFSWIAPDEFRTEMQIFIKTIDDRILTFAVKHSNKIRDVKMKIEKKTKLSVDQQNLFFQGEILDDDNKTVDEYHLCEKSVVDIVSKLRGGMRIYIETFSSEFSFEISNSAEIIDIKNEIQKRSGWDPKDQILIYQGEILQQYQLRSVCDNYFSSVRRAVYNSLSAGIMISSMLIGYQGRHTSDITPTFIFVAHRPSEVNVFVRQIDGEIISLLLNISDKIIDIKNKIHDKTELPTDDQILIYRGEIVDDNYKSIGKMKRDWQKILENNNYILIRKKHRDCSEILEDDQKYIVKMKRNWRKIWEDYRESIGNMYFDCSEILEDNKSIDQYPIINNSIINIVAATSKNEIQILVKTSNKSIIPINIVETSKIIDVKSMISEKTGMQFDKHYFIYENKILDDEKSLIDYQIGDGCVLSIDVDSQFSLFMQAIKSGSLETVKELYDSRFNNMEHELVSPNPLHYACQLNNADIVEFLIGKDFGINSYDRKLNNPIHYACINNCVEILKTLTQYKYKYNLEACDSRGMKPIHLACLNGNIENVKLLIARHCDLNSTDYLERRPLHLACLAGNIDIVKLLIQNKCKIDVLDKSNKSPFNIAEKENFIDIMEIINEKVSKGMIENMIRELDLKCLQNCDHKFCPISLRNKTFNKGVKIKHGGTGKVYKCQFSQNSRQIAIKQISKDKIDSKNIEGNINRFIEKVNHERIIKYFGAFSKEENVFVFMEFMSGGSLRSQISTNPPMISSKVIYYTIQILEGLQFLHSNKIIHRDIKPDNILLDNDGNVKLTDFGLGLLLWTSDGHTAQANTFCGTIDYMAPEIMNVETYSYSADIWSLGVTVIEMATGMRPFQGLPPPKIMYKIAITKTIPYELPKSSSNKMKEFIDQMLILEPSRRPKATDLINKLKEI